jgi:hypothetical protein
MNELFQAIDAYIKKVAATAAEARFNEMMADKMLGIDDGALRKSLDEKAEEAVDTYIENSMDIDDAIKSAVAGYDFSDDIHDRVRAYLRDTTLSVSLD